MIFQWIYPSVSDVTQAGYHRDLGYEQDLFAKKNFMNLPNTELGQFLLCIGVGVGIGAVFAIPVLISRWRAGEKLIQQQRPKPPWTWPLGIFTFGGLALISFSRDRYIFGSVYTVVALFYAVAFILNQNKKKANKAEMATPRRPSDQF